MESSRQVAKFFAVTIITGTIAAAALGLVTGHPMLLLDWFLVLALLAVGCLLVSLVNLLVFGPILWLVSRLWGQKNRPDRQNRDREQ